MSGAAVEVVRSAVPVADLSVVDAALAGDGALADVLRKVRPADLGRDLSRRSVADVRRLLEASDDRRAAAMLRVAHPAVAATALASVEAARAARVLGFMPTDHRARIVAALHDDARASIEAALAPEERALLGRVLAYDEVAVGRLMTPKVWLCRARDTAAEALARLRRDERDIEVAQNCYVVQGEDAPADAAIVDRRLVGVIALRELVLADPAAEVASIMVRDPIAVGAEVPRGDAAEIIQTHEFLSLPVIDGGGAVMGAVRVDDLLEAALRKVGAGLLNQGGVHGEVAAQVPYFQTSLVRVVRSRLTWLVLLFVAETATGTVLRHFEGELSRVVALSFFIPLLIGTGGNAGSQTVSTVIRALALGEVRLRDAARVVIKEVSTGVLLGLLLGCIAFFRALMWHVHMDIAACVALTIVVVCVWANAVGALIPIAAQRAGVDPTVVSAPLITTLVDASGLFLYLTIAHLLVAGLHGP